MKWYKISEEQLDLFDYYFNASQIVTDESIDGVGDMIRQVRTQVLPDEETLPDCRDEITDYLYPAEQKVEKEKWECDENGIIKFRGDWLTPNEMIRKLLQELADLKNQQNRNAELHKLKCEAILDLEKELADAKAEIDRLKKENETNSTILKAQAEAWAQLRVTHRPSLAQKQPEKMVCSGCGEPLFPESKGQEFYCEINGVKAKSIPESEYKKGEIKDG